MSVPRQVLLLLLALALCGRAARAEDAGEEVAGPFPWTADEDTFFLRRFVDGMTGRPVAGATVKLFAEVPHPEPGFGTPTAVGTSGADGWVRIRRDQLDPARVATYGEPHWAYVEAPGLGPDAVMHEFRKDDDWPLRAAAELRVTLHDALDRPVRGAHVGWLLGCGHTPDVRQATTDEHGVARLLGVQDEGFGQLWFVKDGFVSRYLDFDRWVPWGREEIARLETTPVVEGTVLKHDGKPAAGVAVGRSDCHRGPWTRTDAQGRFRLVGLQSHWDDQIFVEADEYPVTSKAHPNQVLLNVPPPGVRAKAILPPPGEEPPRVERTARLVVDVAWPEGVDTDELEVGAAAVRLSDGWQDVDAVGPQRVALFDVPPGRFHVVVESRSHDVPVARVATEVEVPAAGGAYARVTLPPTAVLTLACDLEDAAVDLVVDGEAHPLDLASAPRPYRLFVDPTKPHFLRIAQGPRIRVVPVDPDYLLPNAGALWVPGFEAVAVRARLLDPEGKPARGWLLDEDAEGTLERVLGERPPEAPSEAPDLKTPEGERVDLLVWPEDTARLQPLRLPRRALAAGKEPVDLGEIRLPARPPGLTLRGPDGKPLEAARIEVRLAGRQDELEASAETAEFRALENTPVIAKAVSVYDITDNKKIYGQNDEVALPIASLAKIMTVVEGLKSHDLNDVIYVSPNAVKQAGDFGIFAHEKWRIGDLAKATLIVSANDGAFALSEQEPNFLESVNSKVRRLGTANTIFSNPTGLDIYSEDKEKPIGVGVVASASDVNAMAVYGLLAYPEVFSATTLPEINLISESGFEHNYKNTNVLVGKIPNLLFSKTGFTDTAGGSLVIIFKDKSGHDIAITVLGSTYDGRFEDMEKILNVLYNAN